MKSYDNSMAPRFAQLLESRLAELGNVLHDDLLASSAPAGGTAEVKDFKDMAAEESLAAQEEAQSASAAHALENVLSARRRIRDQTYGTCLGCGEPIDLRRLEALPEAALCTGCQAKDEQKRLRSP